MNEGMLETRQSRERTTVKGLISEIVQALTGKFTLIGRSPGGGRRNHAKARV